MKRKFYVVTKFYDNGTTEGEIITRKEAVELGYKDGTDHYFKETVNHDLYLDVVSTKNDAKQILEDLKYC